MRRTLLSRVVLFSLLLLSAGTAGATEAPVAVSPGSASKLALIEDRCPTFSWATVPGADTYELVVYLLAEGSQKAEHILTERLPGMANSWTPSLESCLRTDGHYAWSVRAVGSMASSDWSAARLFQVMPDPREKELQRALGVVERYLALTEANGGSANVRKSPITDPGEFVRQSTAPAGSPSPGSALAVSGSPCCDGRLPEQYATRLRNDSSGNDPDVLALLLGSKSRPGTNMNYIGFFDWDSVQNEPRVIGEIEGDGTGGVYFAGTAASVQGGITNWERIVGNQVTCDEYNSCTANAWCGGVKEVLGGGIEIEGPTIHVNMIRVLESYPSVFGGGWNIRIWFESDGDSGTELQQNFRAVAICANTAE